MVDYTPRYRFALPAYDETGWDDDENNNWRLAEALLSQYISVLDVQGVWLNGTAYTTGNRVVDPDDTTLWLCNVNHTSAGSPTTFAADRTAKPGYWSTATAAISDATAAAIAAQASATAAASSAAAALSAASSVTELGPVKNAVVNGKFNIWQRGTTFAAMTVGASTRVADRWRSFHNGAGGTTGISRAAVTTQTLRDAGIQYALTYAVTVASTGQTARQLLTEIESVFTFAAQQVTVSFYAYTLAGTQNISAYLFQVFGTGGSPSGTVNGTASTFSINATPTRYSFTTTLGSVFGKTLGSNGDDYLGLVFNLPLTGTWTISITGVQIELGDTMTRLQTMPVLTEADICIRYYKQVRLMTAGRANSGESVGVGVPLPEPMFKTPTFTLVTDASSNVGTHATAGNAAYVQVSAAVTATGAYVLDRIVAADAEIV